MTPTPTTLSLPDRWILSRLDAAAGDVHRSLEAFRFDEAAERIQAFVWHELCDGYLEMVKPVLAGSDAAAAESARGVLRRCLADALALLHPFMPFLTEEIWDKLTGRPGTLIVAPYPAASGRAADAEAEAVVEALRAIVTRVRNFRAERGAIADGADRPLDRSRVRRARASIPALTTLEPLLRHLGRLSDLRFDKAAPGAFQDVVAGLAVGMALPEGAAPGSRRARDEGPRGHRRRDRGL